MIAMKIQKCITPSVTIAITVNEHLPRIEPQNRIDMEWLLTFFQQYILRKFEELYIIQLFKFIFFFFSFIFKNVFLMVSGDS